MINIPNIKEKSKRIARFITRADIYLGLIVVFVGLSAYGLGMLSVQQKTQPELKVYDLFPELQLAKEGGRSGAVASPAFGIETGTYVASKSGTKYHFPWCSSAQRIKEENKVWFKTKEEAEAAGYGPAANCPGL